MAFTFDTKTQATHSGSASASDALTIGARGATQHAILVVLVAVVSANGTAAQSQVTSVKWNTTESLTFLGRESNAFGEANETIEMWYLVDPTTGAHNIDTVLNNTPSGTPNAWSVSAVAHITDGIPSMSGFAHNNSGAAATVDVSSATGSLVVGGALITEDTGAAAPTEGGGQTNRTAAKFINNSGGLDAYHEHSEEAGAATVTISYTPTTLRHASMVAASIEETAYIQFGVIARTYDPAKYQAAAVRRFTATLQATDASHAARARLINNTDGTVIDEISTASLTPVEVIGSAISSSVFPSTSKSFIVKFGGNYGHGPYYCYSADIITDSA